jgi:hypothetical protein
MVTDDMQAAGRRHLLCSQPFVPIEAVAELVEATGMTVFSVPSTSSGTGGKVNAVALCKQLLLL